VQSVAFGWQNSASQSMSVDTISPTLDKSKTPAVAVIGGQHPNAAIGENISPTLTNAMGAGGGHVPNGAIVQKGVDAGFDVGNTITLNLRQGDFTTAKLMVDAINQKFGADTARALDAQSVEVMAPRRASHNVSFLSEIENIEITPAEAAAKVIVNARTGTVVIGQNVRIGAAAVAHGNLSVSVGEGMNVNQPNPFANGQTAVTPASNVAVNQEPARMFKFDSGVSLDELVKTVNKIGASPSDLVAILEALKASGALKAELLVI
jgi:flagellar P-ring protein precursor FlgI